MLESPPRHRGLPPRAFNTRVLLMVGLGAVAVVAALFLPPIAQDAAYHRFADRRFLLGVPNALNVLSNAPFVAVGVLGAAYLFGRGARRGGGPLATPWERWPFVVFFTGVGLTGFGSAYYHLAPTTTRLFWDRLPITIALMSLFASVIAERIGMRAGRQLFVPLLAAGAGSVLYWHMGEALGAGDLRFYGLVQFFPLLAIPLLLVLFPPRYTRTADLASAAGLYGVAKACERYDGQIFALGQLISGHTLKHLASAAAAYWILRMIQARRPVDILESPGAAPVPASHR